MLELVSVCKLNACLSPMFVVCGVFLITKYHYFFGILVKNSYQLCNGIVSLNTLKSKVFVCKIVFTTCNFEKKLAEKLCVLRE